MKGLVCNIFHKKMYFLCFCLLSSLASLVLSVGFFVKPVSAAVPGSNNVRVYTAYMNMNTQEYGSVSSSAINNEDVQVLYPVVDQLSGIFRFLFYPVMTAQTGVKGISIKNIDIMFYTDTLTDPVLDRQVCSHIMAGYGSGGWTSSVSNCGFWTTWTQGEQYAYTHFHFDLTLIPTDGNSSINITSSDLSPFYVTLGTTQYNVNNTIPVYERTLIASNHPVYFGTINYGAITYTKSTTDALLQDVINHQDATTDAVNDPQWVHDQQEVAQNTTDTAQTSLEDNQDIATIENKTTSILVVLNNFLDILLHPRVSTCIMPIDLTAYVGASFYEVDLCHLSPPVGVTNVLNIIFVLFVVGLAVSAVRAILQLYKEALTF